MTVTTITTLHPNRHCATPGQGQVLQAHAALLLHACCTTAGRTAPPQSAHARAARGAAALAALLAGTLLLPLLLAGTRWRVRRAARWGSAQGPAQAEHALAPARRTCAMLFTSVHRRWQGRRAAKHCQGPGLAPKRRRTQAVPVRVRAVAVCALAPPAPPSLT